MRLFDIVRRCLFAVLPVIAFLQGLNLAGQTITYSDFSNKVCYRCHGSPSFGYVSGDFGTVHSLYVNREKFVNSNHGSLNCKDCHGEKFLTFPHVEDSTAKGLFCTACHGQNSKWFNDPRFNEKFTKLRIEENEREFKASVHRKWLGEKMTCFSCHNPHEFDMHSEVTPEKIRYDNNMCLNCHADVAKVYALAGKEFRPVEEIHAWLPNPWLHWKQVRCVDCHSSYNPPNRSHLILEKEYAVRDCEKCHSNNTILMSKLYKYVSRQSVSDFGFINAAIYNNSYIIGATRNNKMDTMSIWIALLTIFGILFHGFIRFATSGLRRKNK